MKYSILYKRSVIANKISTWQIITENNTFYTISGYLDGLKFQSASTECQPKNIGKKNGTTANEQADAEAKAMHTKRLALGYFEKIEDIDNPIYFEVMLAKDWKIEKKKIKYPVYSQPKLDGIRCVILSTGMWSRKGKQIISAPHIFEALKPLFEANPELVLDGELYADKLANDFNAIISCVRKLKPTLEDLIVSQNNIDYHIYDIPSVNGTFKEREKVLMEMDLPKECVKVTSIKCNNEEEVNKQYNIYLDNNYEGQILRVDAPYENKRSKYLLKHKSFIDEEFVILGVKEGIGNLAGKVGVLQFEYKGRPFDAAVNGTHEYITELWNKRDELIGKEATVKYFELTPITNDENGNYLKGGVPKFQKVIAIRDYE